MPAAIRDVMPAFELFQPTSVADTLGLLERHGADAWVMAGGMDTFDWLKDRIRKPRVVVDLSGVSRTARDQGGQRRPRDRRDDDADRSGQSRAREGTLRAAGRGGRRSWPRRRSATRARWAATSPQDARCWYYRGGWPCYRAGGNICYADTPTSINREHAIFDADRCVAVNPSDTAPALIALDAQLVIKRGGQERVVAAQDFFVGPGVDITNLTMLRPGDLLTAIRIPATWASKQFYFEKVRDRQVWDFAAGQHRLGDQRLGQHHRRRADGGQRRGGAAAPARSRGVVPQGQGAQRADGRPAAELAVAGRGAAAAQRLQGAAGEGAREARHSRS